METTINARTSNPEITIKKSPAFLSAEFWVTAENMRFGIVPGLLTFVICLSGIAAACAAPNGVLAMILVGLPSALFLTSIIALAPMRIVVGMAAIVTLIDIGVFLFH